ncbi:hypothetical protein OAG68_02730 [bacterium]|nr:hypothetical protein [bacterium]
MRTPTLILIFVFFAAFWGSSIGWHWLVLGFVISVAFADIGRGMWNQRQLVRLEMSDVYRRKYLIVQLISLFTFVWLYFCLRYLD